MSTSTRHEAQQSATEQQVAPDKVDKPKIGQGALFAAWRQGIKELGKALQALATSITGVDEPGQMWSPTTQAVSQQTGVSQKVNFSTRNQPQGFDAMNPQQTPDAEPQQTDANQPNVELATESILDNLTQAAHDMAVQHQAEQQLEADIEMEN